MTPGHSVTATTSHTALEGSALRYRRAGLLDVPLIFELMQEGAHAGVFSDRFIIRTGAPTLMRWVMGGVLAGYWPIGRRQRAEWRIIEDNRQCEVGFMTVRESTLREHCLELQFLSIKPELRGRGLGRRVLTDLHSGLPLGKTLLVHTTKYARAMQHLLKDMHYKRNTRLNVGHLEEYQSDLAPLQ